MVGRAVGWLDEGDVHVFYGDRVPVNPALARCFEAVLPTVRSPAEAGIAPDELPLRRVSRSCVLLRGLGTIPHGYARPLLRREWERRGHGPILSLPVDLRDHGEAALARRGIGPRDRVVCIHVREGGFLSRLNPYREARNRHRNASITTYLPAIEAIVAGGARVIRLGDPSMIPFAADARRDRLCFVRLAQLCARRLSLCPCGMVPGNHVRAVRRGFAVRNALRTDQLDAAAPDAVQRRRSLDLQAGAADGRPRRRS